MKILSGVRADPNSYHPHNPASDLAESRAFRMAKLMPTAKQVAGSPVPIYKKKILYFKYVDAKNYF